MKQEYMFSQQPWVMLISFLKIIQMYLTFISRRLFHAIFMFKKFWQQIKVIIGLKFSSLIWIQIFLKLCSGKLSSYRMKNRRWDMIDISVRKAINMKYSFNFVKRYRNLQQSYKLLERLKLISQKYRILDVIGYSGVDYYISLQCWNCISY